MHLFGRSLTPTQADVAQAMDGRRQNQIEEQRRVIDRLLTRNAELENQLSELKEAKGSPGQVVETL